MKKLINAFKNELKGFKQGFMQALYEELCKNGKLQYTTSVWYSPLTGVIASPSNSDVSAYAMVPIFYSNEYLRGMVKDWIAKVVAPCATTDRTIIVPKDWDEWPEEARVFLIAHEYGHITLGHMNLTVAEVNKRNTQRAEEIACGKVQSVELEADAYAASIVGKEIAIKAMRQILIKASMNDSVPQMAELLIRQQAVNAM